MDDPLPLSALLSQALVAFTIEFDNEFERLTPHRTTNHGSTSDSHEAPWLVSMVMWLKLMRYVPKEGIHPRALQQATGLPLKEFRTWLTRMSKWWGYLTVSATLIRPTPGGRKAIATWRPLTETIELRWQERYGKETIDSLKTTLQTLIAAFETDQPNYLPILGYDLFSRPQGTKSPGDTQSATLPILLAKPLLAFAEEFERESGMSLAISANVLRLLGEEGTPIRDLPRLSGVSKEAIAMCVDRVQKQGPCRVHARTLLLTPSGRIARETCHSTLDAIEKRWQDAFGKDLIANLRKLLESLGGEPLMKSLDGYPNGWRASLPKREHWPHYPMVLHRGGFPDGS